MTIHMDVPEYDTEQVDVDEVPVDNPVKRKKEDCDGQETSD